MPVDPAAALSAFGGADLKALTLRLRDAFAAHRDEIDRLNVFPVPDGDTGTNLALTVKVVVEEVGALDDDADICDAVARGALLGARGNSGVIFSQVMRGLAETVRERGQVGADGLADALQRGYDHAYAAVAKPVEGTILTVMRTAAETAREAAASGADLRAALERITTAVHDAVARTTEQLEALRAAGVVDAGARGFEVFCEELARLVGSSDEREHPPAPVVERGRAVVGQRESGSLEYRFEVQYLLSGTDGDPAPLRTELERLGDSVVVISAGELMNVHVHTNEVGAVIEAGLDVGRPSRIQVTYFPDQIEAGRQGDAAADGAEDVPGRVPVRCVAVVPGDGLRRIAEEHGAVVVEGTGGDLPSVRRLVAGVRAANADTVLILPGHPNVVTSGRQACAALADETEVVVVERASSVPAVLAAIAVCDVDGDPATVADEVAEAAAACRSGEVVAAVRDAHTPVGEVTHGQPLAVVGDDVVAASDGVVAALGEVLRRLVADGGEVATLIVGADVAADERAEAIALVEEAGLDVHVIDGGQRPALFILGVE